MNRIEQNAGTVIDAIAHSPWLPLVLWGCLGCFLIGMMIAFTVELRAARRDPQSRK